MKFVSNLRPHRFSQSLAFRIADREQSKSQAKSQVKSQGASRLRPASFLTAFVAPFAVACAVSFTATTTATAESIITPPPPDISSKNHILMDAQSGVVIGGRDIAKRVEPASITKLMTAYIAYKALRNGQIGLNDIVPVSEKAWKMGGSRMFIEMDKDVTVEELLLGIVVQSGNDASVALAEFIAGSEAAFAQIMNVEAQRLGMKSSNFVNATGWPDENHYMSAQDIAILARAIILDFPSDYARYSQKQFTYNDITQYNRNRLLWHDASVDGVKTGFTESAGYCLVSSAERDGMRLVAVILSVDSDKQRMSQSTALLNFGFRFYTTKRLFHKHEPLAQIRVWGSRDKFANIGPNRDLYITFPRGGDKQLEVRRELLENLEAPIAQDTEVGKLVAHYSEQFSYEAALVTLDDVAQGSWLRRMSDAIIQMF